VTLELKDIKAIIDLMKKNDLAVFKLEKDGFKLELEAHRLSTPVAAAIPSSQILTSTPIGAETGSSASAGPQKSVYREIVSPMVGTFYSSPSPDSAPYVQIGQEISADSVVCIIEAMKVMNEIKAETKGVIAEIVAENGKPVQFGQVLFRVK